MNILKLTKNLKEFTLDEIEILAEMNVKNELKTLLNANKIGFKNGIYKYIEKKEMPTFELITPPEFKKGKRILFSEAVNGYLWSRKLSIETLKGYKSQLKMNIIPDFGELFLDEITHGMIEDLMGKLKEKHKIKTVSNAITLLGSILKCVFDEGLCKKNPYHGIKNPSPNKLRKDIKLLTKCI